MPNSVSNVTAGKPKVAGAIFRAPAGSALPTDATTALEADYVCMGYISEDGVSNSNSPESGEIKAWGGDTVLTYQSGKPDTWSFKLIEALNANVLAAVYGADNVTSDATTGTITIKANSAEQETAIWVFDMILNGGAQKRVVIPMGAISEIGDVVYADEEAVGYELTINAMPDDDGNTHYEFIKAA